MKRIWKYLLPSPLLAGPLTICLPKGAKVLWMAEDIYDNPSLWAEVDIAEEKEDRHFLVMHTGETYDNCVYITSAKLNQDGPNTELIYHLFEVALGVATIEARK